MNYHQKENVIMLNLGVIALKMGKAHSDAAYQSRKANLAAICDIDEKLLKACSDEYGPEVKASTDWHDMINDPSIDAICVATPDHLHLEMTVTALRAGKHVLCIRIFEALVRTACDHSRNRSACCL